MGIARNIRRFADSLRSQGVLPTLRRASQAVSREYIHTRFIVYRVNLIEEEIQKPQNPNNFSITRYRGKAEIAPEDLDALYSKRDRQEFESQMDRRFGKRAVLWLVRHEGKIAFFMWTILEKHVAPYFLPLGPKDCLVFDVEAFPDFRGMGVLPFALNTALGEFAREGIQNVYIDTAVWNEPCIRSLRKTPFRQIGVARKHKIFGKNIVLWDET
jgi:RimJ/RimL family protein N-acetyltransferase